jgi:O-antigen/teichoic acid export membrane protein
MKRYPTSTLEPYVSSSDGAAEAAVLNGPADLVLRRPASVHRRLLRWSNSSIGQLLPVLVDQGAKSLSMFAAGLLVARGCEKEQYGLYTLLSTIWVWLFALQAGLAGTPYVALSILRDESEKSRYLGSVLVLHLLLSGMAAIGMICFGAVWGRGQSGASGTLAIAAFAVSTVPVLLREFLRQVLLADLRVWRNLAFGLPMSVVSIGVLVWLYRSAELTVSLAYIVLGACSLLPSVWLLYAERRRISFNREQLSKDAIQNWHMGKWLLAKAMATVVSVQIYGWVLAGFHGTASVALYGACLLPISFLSPLAQALNAFLTPKASHTALRGMGTLWDLAVRSTASTLAALFAASGLLLLFCRPVVTFLFQDKYVISPYLMFLFALQMAIIVASTCVCSSIVALRRTDISFKGELVAVAVTIVVGLPLVYGWGVWGVAVGLLLSCSSNMLYQWVAFLRLAAGGGPVTSRETV